MIYLTYSQHSHSWLIAGYSCCWSYTIPSILCWRGTVPLLSSPRVICHQIVLQCSWLSGLACFTKFTWTFNAHPLFCYRSWLCCKGATWTGQRSQLVPMRPRLVHMPFYRFVFLKGLVVMGFWCRLWGLFCSKIIRCTHVQGDALKLAISFLEFRGLAMIVSFFLKLLIDGVGAGGRWVQSAARNMHSSPCGQAFPHWFGRVRACTCHRSTKPTFCGRGQHQ